MNAYKVAVIYGLGWVLVLFDGWALHSHWLAALGFAFLIYSMWSMWMSTPEDEAFADIERRQRDAEGWRKRQILALRTNVESFDEWDHSHRPEVYFVERRAYLAGFDAGRRYERMKELND